MPMGHSFGASDSATRFIGMLESGKRTGRKGKSKSHCTRCGGNHAGGNFRQCVPSGHVTRIPCAFCPCDDISSSDKHYERFCVCGTCGMKPSKSIGSSSVGKHSRLGMINPHGVLLERAQQRVCPATDCSSPGCTARLEFDHFRMAHADEYNQRIKNARE